MKLHELKPNKGGAVKATKRLGRGTGSGQGKTAGKGHKGQNARSGKGTRLGFEGGQMPIYRRLPKRGFTNIFAREYAVVNLSVLNDRFEENTEVTPELLVEAGILKKLYDGVKILGDGDLDKKLTVKANKFSKSATEKIEANGGKVEVI